MLILVLIMMVLLITTANAQEDMKKSIQIINPRPDFALSLRLDKGAGRLIYSRRIYEYIFVLPEGLCHDF